MVVMMKIKCGKGPGFWVKEPYTPFEERMKAAYAADSVHHRLAKGWITEETMSERDRLNLANEPVPPFSDKERKRAERLYPDNWWLIEGETWPPDPAIAKAWYRAVGNATHVMVSRRHATAPSRRRLRAAVDHPEAVAGKRRAAS
jgi:hypothetical protein